MRGNLVLKNIDKYIGIPLVFLLGLFKRKNRKVSENIKTIGVLNTAPIGDTIISSAIINDIKCKYSDAKIYYFCGKDAYQIAQMIAKADVICINISNVLKTIKEINKGRKFDLWVDLGPWPRINSLISAFIKSDFKIGFKSKGQYRHFTYNKYVEHKNDVHELVNYRNLISLIGLDSRSIPVYNVNNKIDDKMIVLHLFPGGYKSFYKKWPDKNWVELIEFLQKHGYSVFLTGAPCDAEDGDRIVNMISNRENLHNIIGKMSLYQTAEIIARCRLIVTINTGIMHLASAMNKNIIALHGPTSIKRWGPVCDNAISVKAETDCSPCLHLGFEYGCNLPGCMESITVAQIITIVESLLLKNKTIYQNASQQFKNVFIGNALG